MIRGHESYEWLVPVGHYGYAHAFVLHQPLSACLRHERWPTEEDHGWEAERLLRGEPQRARCRRCQELISQCDGMQEVTRSWE